MERDVSALEKRLAHEKDIRPDIILYEIFDCILDKTIEPSSDLLSTNALEHISRKLSQYHNLSEGGEANTFEQAFRSESIINQIKDLYLNEKVDFDVEQFKHNWPNTLNELDAPWSFVDHMSRSRSMILRSITRHNK